MNYKTVNISNFESYIIDYFDDKLSENEQQALFAFLETHPQLMADFELFKQSEELRLVPDKNVIFTDKQRLKHTTFRHFSAIWIAAASMAAILLLFFLFRPSADIPSPSVTPEPIFVQTDDNEPETVSDTTNSEPPKEERIPQKELKPKSAPVSFITHTEKVILSTDEPETAPAPEISPSEQNTEIVASNSTETSKILEPDVVLIKTIPESEPATEELLFSYQEQQQKKHRFLKVLSWGVKQYNYVANDDITVMKVENLTTNETVYYLCRGE
jgi:hypothetical protein